MPLVQVLQETDNGGIIQATYTYGQGLISMNRNGADVYYHYDGLGSVKQLTDSSGAIITSYTYDSFGNLIASSGTAPNTYGFTGQQQFNEADNLVFLRARYYSPFMGRFISRDPIGYVDGLNLYAYVSNNPIRYRDPSGLMRVVPGLFVPIPDQSCTWLIGNIARLFYYNVIGDDRGVENDKFAHCYISCRLTQECGEYASIALGYLKELRDAIMPGDEWDWSDIDANKKGNEIGNLPGPRDLKKSCEEGCSADYGDGGGMYLP